VELVPEGVVDLGLVVDLLLVVAALVLEVFLATVLVVPAEEPVGGGAAIVLAVPGVGVVVQVQPVSLQAQAWPDLAAG